MWNGYGVCFNLALSGEPSPLHHMTTLTTAAEIFASLQNEDNDSNNNEKALGETQTLRRL